MRGSGVVQYSLSTPAVYTICGHPHQEMQEWSILVLGNLQSRCTCIADDADGCYSAESNAICECMPSPQIA